MFLEVANELVNAIKVLLPITKSIWRQGNVLMMRIHSPDVREHKGSRMFMCYGQVVWNALGIFGLV